MCLPAGFWKVNGSWDDTSRRQRSPLARWSVLHRIRRHSKLCRSSLFLNDVLTPIGNNLIVRGGCKEANPLPQQPNPAPNMMLSPVPSSVTVALLRAEMQMTET
ncbi:Cytochrome P450 monooxygenase ATR2 [Fusarium oxysporum f. sp. albedinis]|nr:Cytochrome P450 monooxygenase ATR2 [Fusarium oxysporum f. sp. albedinis]